MRSIPDKLNIVIMRNGIDSRMLRTCRKILTLEQKVKAMEMFDNNSSSRTVGEAFGVSKDTMQKLVKLKIDVLQKYNGNRLES